jgi:hypothetical protein
MQGPKLEGQPLRRRIPTAVTLCAMMGALLALCACEKGKPRHVPVDPMALAPPPPGATAAPAAGLSAGLPRLKAYPGFSLDRIGAAADPLNRKPAVTPADAPIVFTGFGFDPVAKAPGKGADVVVDGKPYGALYGHARADVAVYFKIPGLTAVGYALTLPPGALAKGQHSVVVRVVAADGKGYFQSPNFAFTAN